MLFRAYESPEGRGDGKGGLDQPVQGPWHGRKGNAWGHPCTSWFIIPRLVRRPIHVPWPKVFFFFAALYCTTSGPGGKVTSSHAGSLPLRVIERMNYWLVHATLRPSLHSKFVATTAVPSSGPRSLDVSLAAYSRKNLVMFKHMGTYLDRNFTGASSSSCSMSMDTSIDCLLNNPQATTPAP